MVNVPDHAAAGMLSSSRSEAMLYTCISGRRGRRSTQAPAGSPIASQGSHAAAVSALTCKALACRVTTATSGTATPLMLVPTALVVSPVHNSRKSR